MKKHDMEMQNMKATVRIFEFIIWYDFDKCFIRCEKTSARPICHVYVYALVYVMNYC